MVLADHANTRERAERSKHYVVQTKPNNEAFATRFLQADAFTVYFPQIIKRRAHAGRVDYVARPLFAGYLFVRDDGRPPFYFRSAPGVASIVSFGSAPIRVDESVLDEIRGRAGPDGLIPYEPIQPGTTVRAKGFDAIFESGCPNQRATVLISLLGRATRVAVAYNSIVTVAELNG